MREVEVLRDGHWQWIQWRKITVGDVVKVAPIFFKIMDVVIISIPARIAFFNMHRSATTIFFLLT